MSVVSIPPTKETHDMDKPCGSVYQSPQYIACVKEFEPCSITIREVNNVSKEERADQSCSEAQNTDKGAFGDTFPGPKKIVRKHPCSNNLTTKTDDKLSPEQEKMLNKKNLMARRREEFNEKGALMALQGIIEHRVKCATMSTDHLLAQKRTKLRELLLAEDIAYTAEYVAKCQKAAVMREELLKSRAFELQTKLQKERQEYIDQKLLEHKVETCDAIRLVMSQKNLKDVKKDQLWQIKEKHVMDEAKREEDRMYHDLMIKNMMAVKEKEEENAKLIWFKKQDARIAFEEQIKLKKQKQEEEKKLKELERLQIEEEIRMIHEENNKETSVKVQKNEKIKADFREAMLREREVKEARKREEEEIDRAFTELLNLELEKEKRKEISNKERIKREMDIFLEKSKELKQQREEEEKKFDEMLRELEEKKRMQKDAERNKLKAARQELFLNVLKEREEQVKMKRFIEKQEEEQRQAEIQLLTMQIEQQKKIREEYERRCALQREEYKCQLLQQMKEVEEEKKKKKQAEEEYDRKRREQEEREIEEVKSLLKNLPNAEKPHPLKVYVKEQPPRYVCPFPHPI